MAITVAPLTTTVMTSIDDERHAGAASGINNTVARAAGLLAIAAFGAVAVILFSRDLSPRLGTLPPPVRAAMSRQRLSLGAATPPPGLDAPTRARVQAAIDASFVRAFRADMLAAAIIAAVSACGAVAIRRK
jgi:hypothetical protein